MNSTWSVSFPIEGVLVDYLIGRPEKRLVEPDWEFAGNLAIRICHPSQEKRTVIREVGVLMFRRIGDRPYKRRIHVNSEVLQAAVMQTIHPVFTRDVANNVWHLKPKAYRAKIRTRLGALLAWPDESIVVITEKTVRHFTNGPLELDDDLVGVPHKKDYFWP